jgi:hypothetical protein
LMRLNGWMYSGLRAPWPNRMMPFMGLPPFPASL